MSPRVDRLHVGPYVLVRQLESGRLAERWLAFNECDQTAHVACRFKLSSDKAEQRKFLAAAEALAPLVHPHLLPIEQFSLGTAGGGWVVLPYTGSHDGLVTLASLLKDKGGRLSPTETERAMTQLLEAIDFAHASGFQNGPMGLEDVVVDRRGSLAIELYGLRRRMESGAGGRPAVEVIRDEVRSVIEIGYTLLTGLAAEEPRIKAGRLVEKLDHRWDEWFDEGLDALTGFMSAEDALASMPGVRREMEGRDRASPMRTVIGRVARALRSS